MRKALADFLISTAENDKRIIFLTGDLGFGVFDSFKDHFPDRYLNIGIAEANMVGIAAGLAQQGFRPFCYSIASFLIPRSYEQIRFFSGYNDFKIIYIGAGGGFTYGESGATHHSLDDIGLSRLIPRLDVYVPSGPVSLTDSLGKALLSENSTYIQIGKFGEQDVISQNESIDCETLVITYGPIANEVQLAISSLDKKVRLLVLNQVQPFPIDLVQLYLKGIKKVFLVEEQFESSGILIELMKCLLEYDSAVSFVRLGPRLEYSHVVQDSKTLRSLHGFDSKSIQDQVIIGKN